MQTTNTVLLVKPSCFSFNTETFSTNAFQNDSKVDTDSILNEAIEEFTEVAKQLLALGLNVFVFDDTPVPPKPDAVFPNNWASFHSNGLVILYPMYAPNRRLERRMDIIDNLRNQFDITSVIDISGYENENEFLEGTGSIVFDHENKIAYACISPRTNEKLFLKVTRLLDYKAICFKAVDKNDKEIYHTNVMMCIGKNFAVVCLESIADVDERNKVADSLTKTGHRIVPVTLEQMNYFAGNMLELNTGQNKSILAMSQTAFDSLDNDQKNVLSTFCKLVPFSINTIETVGGGSIRCMIAEVFLEKKERDRNFV